MTGVKFTFRKLFVAYTKLFSKLLASSVWNLDLTTKVVWVTLLALKDRDQIVSGSVGGIAHQARVPIEDCRRALEILSSPDPDDTSKVDEGRRIRLIEGIGWEVVNGAMYRDSKDEDERRAWMANYMREYRKRKQNVNNRKGPLTPLTDVNTAEQSRAEQKTSREETEFILSNEQKKEPSLLVARTSRQPKDWREFLDYALKHKCTKDEATYFFTTWKANGWTTNGKAMKDWRAKIVSWHTQGYYKPRDNEK